MNTHTLFATVSPRKLFLMASIPGAIGMLASALYQLIDGMLVGRILGETAFAAINLAMPFVIINFALADLIGVGSSVPISINLGQKKDEEANNIFTCACLLIVGVGVVIGAALFFAAPGLITLMGAEGEFATLAVRYLQVYALCSPITTIVFATDNYLRICGKIKGSMVLNILMSTLSVAFEVLFLSVFKWGIWAAALGTCLGMAICALIALIPFFLGKMKLRFCKPRLSKQMIRRIVACGSPNFLSNIAARITSILMNAILVRLGGQSAVSVYGILMYVEGFIQPLLYGMCDSMQPAVGYNWGAGKYSRVRAIEKYCFIASGIISIASIFIIYFLPQQITGLFMSNVNGDLMTMAVGALQLFAFTYTVRWLSFATQSYMLAIEKPIPASMISLSISLVFPVLLILLLWPLGLTGIWMNFAGSSILAAILSLIILLKYKKQLMQNDAKKISPKV